MDVEEQPASPDPVAEDELELEDKSPREDVGSEDNEEINTKEGKDQSDLDLNESSNLGPDSPDLEPSPQSPTNPNPDSPDCDPTSDYGDPASQEMNEYSDTNNSDANDDIDLTSGRLSEGHELKNQEISDASQDREDEGEGKSDKRDTEYGSDSERGGDSVSNFSVKDQTEAGENAEKSSEKDSDGESVNSSVVSQRNTENLSSAREERLGNDVDWTRRRDSVKSEEEGGVVVGLEALDSLANENGRCGSPSIVSEATDTVAGSLVVETGSLGGESSTVRSMPRSEASDYDYQDVENGEDEEYPNTVPEPVNRRLSESGNGTRESKPESPLGARSPPGNGQSNDGSNGQASRLIRGSNDAELDESVDETIRSPEADANNDIDNADLYPADSMASGNQSDKDDEGSIQEPAPEEDFDYDDLDLEPVSETAPVSSKGGNYSATAEPADSSGVTDFQKSSRHHDHSAKKVSSKLASDSYLVTSTDSVSRDSVSSGSRSVRSPKTNLAEDHVELDYDEEDIGAEVEEKGHSVEVGDEELENGELPDDEEEEGEAGDKSDEGEVDDDDDCEEGEIREPGNRKPFVKPVCRFFLNGKCTWGTNCRFLHPGVNDKGNYRLIERPDFNNTGPGMGIRGPFGPGPWGPGDRVPDPEFIPPVADPLPSESAWERGLRHAKELMKKASQRKETDPGFEEKRLNLSLEEEREFNKENDQRRLGKDPYMDSSFDDDIYDKPSSAWQQGQYENFEVRWNREPDFPYRTQDKDRGPGLGAGPGPGPGPGLMRDRRASPPSPRMGSGPPHFMGNPNHPHGPPMHPADRYNKRSRESHRDKWRGEEETFNSGGPRVRADTWHDPWRRSKSPKRKPRESPSRSRSRGRRRYRRSYSYSSSYTSSSFSGSSRSRSRSSYSSLSSRSSHSRSSSFSSRSRSRSMDMSRKRPPQDPHSVGPPGSGPGMGPGAMPAGLAPGAGPAGDRKLGQAAKTGEPRSAVSVKPRHPRGGPDKRRPVIGPMPRPPPKEKPPPQMPEGRGRGMRDRDDRGMARGRGRGRPREGPIPGRPPAKKRGASNSSSGSSRSRSRSHSSSSTSRSRSVSSVSSISSTSSSSSSGSADSEHLYRDIAEPDAPEKDKASQQARNRKKGMPGMGPDHGPGLSQGPPMDRDRERGRRGNNQRERPPREKRLRRSPPVDIPPGPRGMPRPGRPDTRRGPMETSGKPQVSSTTPVKSKDPMKMVGQKSNIKLTLISKPSEKNGVSGKKRPAEGSAGPPAKKPPVTPTKAPSDKGSKPAVKADKPVPVPNPRLKPPTAVPRQNPPGTGRPTASPTKPVGKPAGGAAAVAATAAAAAAAAKAAKKSTSSRREELLKQLKAVEDAIARKRSKLP